MSMTRRAFLIATGVSGIAWSASGGAAPLPRTWVIDENLTQSRVLIRRVQSTGARIAFLSGDAGWLWFGRLSSEAMASAQGFSGLTRSADAFVLTQLGAEIGLRATQRTLGDGAVFWTLDHASPRRFARMTRLDIAASG